MYFFIYLDLYVFIIKLNIDLDFCMELFRYNNNKKNIFYILD